LSYASNVLFYMPRGLNFAHDMGRQNPLLPLKNIAQSEVDSKGSSQLIVRSTQFRVRGLQLRDSTLKGCIGRLCYIG